MRFSDATRNAALQVAGPDNDIRSVQYDSRRVSVGECFCAIRGGISDGNRFLDAAIAQGASAVITDVPGVFAAARERYPGVAFGLAKDARCALATIAAELLGHPERKLACTGVTGTNGKTTTTWLLDAVLSGAGRKTLLAGTIAVRLDEREVASSYTTPMSSDLLQLFANAMDAGATEAVMEVSSHALEQRRVWGIPFDVAVFTNLTRDHLDFHGTMENYFAAKKRLFLENAPRVSLLCADDAMVAAFAAELRARKSTDVQTYGISAGDWRAESIAMSATGTRLSVRSPLGDVEMRSQLVGRVNVLNTLAALAAACARGVPLEQAAEMVGTLDFVPGRFQRVPGDQAFTVVVDYAHTDDALRNLTQLARELVAGRGRVITMFGCGGDRDKTKRPKMAQAAAEHSDLVILTSDNPRSEDPMAILRDAEVGFMQCAAPYRVIADRADAIAAAIAEARDGDIVLLAGKGHEKTQTLRDRVVPFDDVAVAQEALRALKADVR